MSVNSEPTDFTLSEVTVGSVDLAGCKGSGIDPVCVNFSQSGYRECDGCFR